jgi:hypothetical protein
MRSSTEATRLSGSSMSALAHRDRSHFGGRTSLSGHNGHGWSGGRPDPDANDPLRTSAVRFCCDAQDRRALTANVSG